MRATEYSNRLHGVTLLVTPPQAGNGGTAERMAELAEWQKWLHTYYLRYTADDDTDDDDDDTLIFYSMNKPIGPAAQESVKSCLLNIFFVILL